MAVRFLALVLIVSACGRNVPLAPTSPPLAAAPRNHLVVAESNYEKGMLEVFDLTTSDKPRQFGIHSDAVARAPQGAHSIFIVNRFKSDSILTLGAEGLKKEANYSVGTETNPQDFLWVNPGLALITRFHSPDLLLVNPTSGQEQGKVSLAKFADSDGVPEMAWMTRDDDNVAIALQKLQDFFPATVGAEKTLVRSQVVVYDLNAKTLKDYTLAHSNPVTEFKQGPNGEWYLGEAGYTGWASKIDGGIERLAAKTFEPKGMIVTEKALGGDIIDFEIISDQVGVAIVGVPEVRIGPGRAKAKTLLVSFDPSNGAKLGDLETAEGGQLHQVLLDRPRGLFYIADRHPTEFGIRIFSATTLKEDKAAKRAVHLPPYHISWMD